MIDQWDNPKFASNWDRTSHIGNPTRQEMTDILLTVVGPLGVARCWFPIHLPLPEPGSSLFAAIKV